MKSGGRERKEGGRNENKFYNRFQQETKQRKRRFSQHTSVFKTALAIVGDFPAAGRGAGG